MVDEIGEVATGIGDVLSVGVVIGTVSQMLPSVAAVLSIIWTAVRIYETKTVQRLLGRESG